MNTISYEIVEEKYNAENKSYISYGIVAVMHCDDGSFSIIASVRNITPNRDKLEELVDMCNRLSLSPIHLNDVVEDFIAY